ncbi:MAG: hypothetical protein ACRDVL_09525 [Acidimicrobiia bacterium]
MNGATAATSNIPVRNLMASAQATQVSSPSPSPERRRVARSTVKSVVRAAAKQAMATRASPRKWNIRLGRNRRPARKAATAKLATWKVLSKPVTAIGTPRRVDTSGRRKGLAAKTAATTAAPPRSPAEAWGRTDWISRVGSVMPSRV